MTDDTTLPKLLQGLQDLAHDLLKSAGGFPPFGGTVSSSGELGIVFNGNDVSQSKPDAALQYILGALQAQAGQHDAMGVAFTARAEMEGQPGQSVTIYTLHQRGANPIDIIEPFARDQSGQVQYGELSSRQSPLRVFVDDRPLTSKIWPRAN